MRTIILFIFCTSLNLFANDLRVVWWNIQSGYTNEKYLEKHSKNPLRLNIAHLVKDERLAPDVIALGEYQLHSKHHVVIKDILQSKYNFFSFFPYNIHSPERGIAVYSKYKTQNEFGPLNIDRSTCEREKLPNSWDRTFIKLTLKKGDTNYSIYPIHLNNPWPSIKENHKKDLVVSKDLMSKVLLAMDIAYGKENPNYDQLTRLIDEYNNNYTEGEKSLLIGDFNIPTDLKGVVSSKGYRELSENFTDAFESNPMPTFPAPESDKAKSYPPLKIDHAFVNQNTDIIFSRTINYLGSDHFPIEVIIK